MLDYCVRPIASNRTRNLGIFFSFKYFECRRNILYYYICYWYSMNEHKFYSEIVYLKIL